jgi:hypothetical protein
MEKHKTTSAQMNRNSSSWLIIDLNMRIVGPASRVLARLKKSLSQNSPEMITIKMP